jgi:hypothetical protein
MRHALDAVAFVLSITALGCGGTPASPGSSPDKPQLFVAIEPPHIKAVSSTTPSFVADNGRPWWMLSYTVKCLEMDDLSPTIDNFNIQFRLADGTLVLQDTPKTPFAFTLSGRSSIQLPSQIPAYVQIPEGSSATNPSGVLTAKVYFRFGRGLVNSGTTTITADVVPQ